MTDLRDHSQPCEHTESGWIPGTLMLGRLGRSDLWQCDEPGCPGGREVTDDMEKMWVCLFDGPNDLCEQGKMTSKHQELCGEFWLIPVAADDVAAGHPCQMPRCYSSGYDYTHNASIHHPPLHLPHAQADCLYMRVSVLPVPPLQPVSCLQVRRCRSATSLNRR